MPKCKRKKQRVFDFFHLTKKRMNNNADWPDWMYDAWNKERGAWGSLWRDKTIAGEDIFMTVGRDEIWRYKIIQEGDYIVRQPDDGLMPYGSSLFEALFERVKDKRDNAKEGKND